MEQIIEESLLEITLKSTTHLSLPRIKHVFSKRRILKKIRDFDTHVVKFKINKIPTVYCDLIEKLNSQPHSTFYFFSFLTNSLFSKIKIKDLTIRDISSIKTFNMFPICFLFLMHYKKKSISSSKKKVQHKKKEKYFSFIQRIFEKPPTDLIRKQFAIRQLIKIKKINRCSICFIPLKNKNHLIFNEIPIQCSKCNLKVHPTCYGIKLLGIKNKTKWKCDKCNGNLKKIYCSICMKATKGAMKRTIHNNWSHIVCALWIEEPYIVYTPKIELVKIKSIRYHMRVCRYCKKTSIMANCYGQFCREYFHPLCLLKHDPRLLVNVNIWHGKVFSFCFNHHPHLVRRREIQKKIKSKHRIILTKNIYNIENISWFKLFNRSKCYISKRNEIKDSKKYSENFLKRKIFDLELIESAIIPVVSFNKCPFCPILNIKNKFFYNHISIHHKNELKTLCLKKKDLKCNIVKRNVLIQSIVKRIEI